MTDAGSTTQIHSIYIDAPAEKVWEALTSSEYTNKYGYGGDLTLEPKPGGKMIHHTTPAMKQMGMGDVALTSTVVEIDPPNRLVLDFQAAWHLDEPRSGSPTSSSRGRRASRA
ncbi:SRPBCC domain-containing protein [Prauserella oleivorans]